MARCHQNIRTSRVFNRFIGPHRTIKGGTICNLWLASPLRHEGLFRVGEYIANIIIQCRDGRRGRLRQRGGGSINGDSEEAGVWQFCPPLLLPPHAFDGVVLFGTNSAKPCRAVSRGRPAARESVRGVRGRVKGR